MGRHAQIVGRLVALAAVCVAPAAALADEAERPASPPMQLSASGQLGAAFLGRDGSAAQAVRLDLGARLEALFLRRAPRDLGVGGYLEARTAAFVHGDYGGGALLLLPVSETFPIWLGAGAFARRGDDRWAPGLNASVAWGARPLNYHSAYAMAYGLVLDVRATRGPSPVTDLVLAVSIDFEAIILPGLIAYGALRR